MTSKDKQSLKRMISLLNKAAEIADRLEITLGNGAELGSCVGGMADELEIRLKEAQATDSMAAR